MIVLTLPINFQAALGRPASGRAAAHTAAPALGLQGQHRRPPRRPPRRLPGAPRGRPGRRHLPRPGVIPALNGLCGKYHGTMEHTPKPARSHPSCFPFPSALLKENPWLSGTQTSSLRATKSQSLQTSWQSHAIQAWVKLKCKSQGLETCWQSHPIRASVKLISKSQGLETCWQSHPIEALVKKISKSQGSQTRWQPIQALVKLISKSQGLQTCWQNHPIQALVKVISKSQGLQTWWQNHPIQALVRLLLVQVFYGLNRT